MRVRKLVATVGALVAVAATQPASAEDTTLGANTGLAGFVAASIDQQVAGSAVPYRVSGECKFAGALTPANTLIVGYGGATVASGPIGKVTPLLTTVRCEINNASGNVQARDIALNGSAAAIADSTLLATSGPKEWPVEDITVCVSGFGIWGPTPVYIVELPRTCQTPNG